MDILVVAPVYNEEEALPGFYRALAEALDRLPQSAEIIFADDVTRQLPRLFKDIGWLAFLSLAARASSARIW